MIIEHDTFRLAQDMAKKENRAEFLDLVCHVAEAVGEDGFLHDLLSRIADSTLTPDHARELADLAERLIDREAGR